MKIEGNTFKAAPPVEEIEGASVVNFETILRPTVRRRRSTARRAWGPIARFFLRHLFRGMNR